VKFYYTCGAYYNLPENYWFTCLDIHANFTEKVCLHFSNGYYECMDPIDGEWEVPNYYEWDNATADFSWLTSKGTDG
jgi:hypothetical protein